MDRVSPLRVHGETKMRAPQAFQLNLKAKELDEVRSNSGWLAEREFVGRL